jgi:hypothetical protein
MYWNHLIFGLGRLFARMLGSNPWAIAFFDKIMGGLILAIFNTFLPVMFSKDKNKS